MRSVYSLACGVVVFKMSIVEYLNEFEKEMLPDLSLGPWVGCLVTHSGCFCLGGPHSLVIFVFVCESHFPRRETESSTDLSSVLRFPRHARLINA